MRKGVRSAKSGRAEKGMGAQAYYRSRRRIDKAVSAMVKGKKTIRKIRDCAWSLLLVVADNAERHRNCKSGKRGKDRNRGR